MHKFLSFKEIYWLSNLSYKGIFSFVEVFL